MSEVYIFTCKGCGKRFKRYAMRVYGMGGDSADLCHKCNQDIPFDEPIKPTVSNESEKK